MIVTRTPFRITLGGGGTDLPSYYQRHGGFIFAMGLDRYMYVMLNPSIVDRKIRLHYTQSEIVDHVDELRHELAREALRLHGVSDGVEISSLADLPAGTGMGSSSCYLVGLLTALRAWRRDLTPLQNVAEEACHIELDILGKGIGKQDQYMAVMGGLTVLEIDRSGKVQVHRLNSEKSSLTSFIANTHLYYTGEQRDATQVLADQDLAMRAVTKTPHQVEESLRHIQELGARILEAVEAENYDVFGELLHEHWMRKKAMSVKISLSKVDAIYDHARQTSGVRGGKLVGAGGGGFLMLYAPARHRELEMYMLSQGMMRLHYGIEPSGSTVVVNMGRMPEPAIARSHVAARL